MKTIKQNREYKRLADENNLEIAVDFGFIKLKQMFNIRIEIISSLLVFSYLLMHAELRRSLMIVLYVLLLWFFFAGLRFSKYSIKPVLKESVYAVRQNAFIIPGYAGISAVYSVRS